MSVDSPASTGCVDPRTGPLPHGPRTSSRGTHLSTGALLQDESWLSHQLLSLEMLKASFLGDCGKQTKFGNSKGKCQLSCSTSDSLALTTNLHALKVCSRGTFSGATLTAVPGSARALHRHPRHQFPLVSTNHPLNRVRVPD